MLRQRLKPSCRSHLPWVGLYATQEALKKVYLAVDDVPQRGDNRAICGSSASQRTYVGPDGFRDRCGYTKKATPSAAAQDQQVAEQLWTATEQMTGVQYLYSHD